MEYLGKEKNCGTHRRRLEVRKCAYDNLHRFLKEYCNKGGNGDENNDETSELQRMIKNEIQNIFNGNCGVIDIATAFINNQLEEMRKIRDIITDMYIPGCKYLDCGKMVLSLFPKMMISKVLYSPPSSRVDKSFLSMCFVITFKFSRNDIRIFHVKYLYMNGKRYLDFNTNMKDEDKCDGNGFYTFWMCKKAIEKYIDNYVTKDLSKFIEIMKAQPMAKEPLFEVVDGEKIARICKRR